MAEEKKAKKAKKISTSAVEKLIKELEDSDNKQHKWAANNLRVAIKLLKV
tara:strand:- start:678 stop:827 length:150 start_codon:yes stop_codon:yes gene_type:complete